MLFLFLFIFAEKSKSSKELKAKELTNVFYPRLLAITVNPFVLIFAFTTAITFITFFFNV